MIAFLKKKYAFWLFITAAMLLLPSMKYTSGKDDDCLKEVKAIFETMYSQLPQKGKVNFVNYEIIVKNRPQNKLEKEEVKRTDIKMFSGVDEYWFVSNDLSVYQDKHNSFTVLPSRKVIYWGESNMGVDKTNRLENVRKLQDTLFKGYSSVSCKTSTEGGANMQVTVTLQKKWADYMHIKSVTYFINTTAKEIKRQLIEYDEHKTMKSLEYVFKEINYDYKKVNLNTPVKNLFISSGSKLNKTYKGYQLLDVRKKK